MKIKIRKDAYARYQKRHTTRGGAGYTGNVEWAQLLRKVQGMTLEVETEYLFSDQFNTVPVEGISEKGLRIMEEDVEEVIDDIRPLKMRCNWCGKVSDKGGECSHCCKSEYLELFGNYY